MMPVMAFDASKPNVVIFGDSNTWVFGPAFRDDIVAQGSIPKAQILIKYQSGSKPSQWIAGHKKGLWTGAEKFEGPSVADSLSASTLLVVIGLGGNMGTSSAARAKASELLDQVEAAAPKARIVWRGVPPSTRKKDGELAPLETKLKRYTLNQGLMRELVARDFRVLDLDGLSESWGAGDRRVYIDLISLHACGPATSSQKKIGTAKDLEYERDIIESAAKPHLAGVHVEAGPWTSFVAARDNAITSHVPRSCARELVDIIGATGALVASGGAVEPAKPQPKKADEARYRVIDAKALIRKGPPKFRATTKIIALGTVVRVESREGQNVRVHGVDGVDYGWTRITNLELVETETEADVEPVVRSRHEQQLVVHQDAYTVIDNRALLREGPPSFAALKPKKTLPMFARVRVDRTEGKYALTRSLADDSAAWTASSNLRLLFRDIGALEAAPLRPAAPVVVPKKGAAKRIAKVYNRLGGLMDRLAEELQIETAAVLAVWMAESGGRQQQPGAATIRFENHVLWKRWGKANEATYDMYFRHGGHDGVTGKAYQNHGCNKSGADEFEKFHGDQTEEYTVLELAQSLAGKETALQCISMGGPQVMGFNHGTAGYKSAGEMYKAFQSGERAQVLGFFEFVRGYNRNMIRYIREHDWVRFGKKYNGSDTYGPKKIEPYFETAGQVLAARA